MLFLIFKISSEIIQFQLLFFPKIIQYNSLLQLNSVKTFNYVFKFHHFGRALKQSSLLSFWFVGNKTLGFECVNFFFSFECEIDCDFGIRFILMEKICFVDVGDFKSFAEDFNKLIEILVYLGLSLVLPLDCLVCKRRYFHK